MTPYALILRRTGSRGVTACRHACERLYYRRIRRTAPEKWRPAHRQRLLGGGQRLDEVITAYHELFPRAVEMTIRRADRICDHVFDLLGSGPVALSPPGPPYQPIDWHWDFKSGYRWDRHAFFRDISGAQTEGVDVKVPWELSRFQHLNTLGQAYVLTGSRTYRAEFVSQIEDWIQSNPVGFGVNWKCTMDVAIRAANWLTAAECFLVGDALEPAFVHRFHASLHEHAEFIYSHLERYGTYRTNHYLADIAGLLFIAVHCPFFRESRRWLRFCIRELSAQMERQVYPDGCHFEASTCYHRLALEMFLFASLLVAVDGRQSERDSLARVAERILGAGYIERLHRMFVATLHLLKPSGRMPQIGDNDSGRFLVLASHDVLDMRYLLPFGAVFFEEPAFKVQEFGFSEDALWAFGRRGYEVWNRLEGRSIETIESRSFPDAGWYVLRKGDDYCLVSCGPNGPHGGHAHNDKLGVELVLGGRDVVVDPGTYVYTPCPRDRNTFRSTRYHNTVEVDGCEQSELSDGEVFTLPDRVRIQYAGLTRIAGRPGFEGQIEYAGIVHKRTVCLDEEPRRWRIEDRVSCPRPTGGEVTFHLSPDVASRGTHVFNKGHRKPFASIEAAGGSMETRTYDYSGEYGVSTAAQCVSIRIPDLTRTAAVVTTFCSRCEDKDIPAKPDTA